MSLKVVHVTVGSTKFDALIEKITTDKVLRILKKRGCEKLILQLGGNNNDGKTVDAENIYNIYKIRVEQYNFKFEPIRTDILAANLVIGHAGAGTCMDILNSGRAALIVVNEELMDNHQIELALQLAEDGYLYYCGVHQLEDKLETLNFEALKPYSQTNNMEKFVEYLNNVIRS